VLVVDTDQPAGHDCLAVQNDNFDQSVSAKSGRHALGIELRLMTSPQSTRRSLEAMTPESIRSCGQRIVDEVLNQGDLAVADDLIDPCCSTHCGVSSDPIVGLDRVKKFVVRLRRAFPDVSVRIEDNIVEGDTLVQRLVLTGTHTGRSFLGIPAWGGPVVIGAVLVCRHEHGKIREGWIYADQLDIMRKSDALSVIQPTKRKGNAMSYAIFSSWTAAPEVFAASGGEDTLENVIVPMVQASPGFVRAHWTESITADNRELLSYTEYDSESNANAMVALMSSNTPPPGVELPAAGPELSWVKVVRVVASA
jgi:predicted ester cyclase